MSDTFIILGMAAITYATRYVGLRLTALKLPPFWLAFLRFVPVSVFAALIAPALAGTGSEGVPRVLAAVLAALLIWRSRQLWLGLLVGMAAFWLLRSWLT